ncbi:MAG: hypothetical protein WC530_10880, partial [Candidatus Omnitrophota bacterium]
MIASPMTYKERVASLMACSRAAVLLGLLLCSWQCSLYATHADENLAMEEHSKVVTTDATPNDPGQVELWSSYSIQGGKFAWNSDGKREKNGGVYQNQLFQTQLTVGVYKNIDVGIITWFQHTLDKTNNYNEFRDMMNPDTRGPMEDETEGPTHGFGWGDLG